MDRKRRQFRNQSTGSVALEAVIGLKTIKQFSLLKKGGVSSVRVSEIMCKPKIKLT